MNLNLKSIFLFDGVGAVVSFLMTGLLLPQFSTLLGIPTQLFYILAIFPFIYAVYSLSCYFFIKQQRLWMLAVIILANLFYCFLSVYLILNLKDISLWGKFFLFLEVIVIMAVVLIEVHIFRRTYV